MKITNKTDIKKIATIVCEELALIGISAVLTGGAVVSIYTNNEYESYDLDFITEASLKQIEKVLVGLGFKRDKKYFVHPQTKYFIDFPSPPLVIGNEPVKEWDTLKSNEGRLYILTPTQSVMDRLAAYYHWNDLQSLDQAVMIASKHPIKLSKVKEWSKREGALEKFNKFKQELRLASKAKKT